MKTIKFRIWDNKNKTMFSSGATPMMISSFFKATAYIKITGMGIYEQFIGIVDNNGKDIYEGDIVTMHQFLFDGNEVEKQIGGIIGQGEYGPTLAQIRNEFVQEYAGHEAGEGEFCLNDFYGLHDESWEIIGNIHENPEILTHGASK